MLQVLVKNMQWLIAFVICYLPNGDWFYSSRVDPTRQPKSKLADLVFFILRTHNF